MWWKKDKYTIMKVIVAVTAVKQETVKKRFQRKNYSIDDMEKVKEFILLRIGNEWKNDIEDN